MGNFDVWIWFVVLVPLAALAGWVIGRRGGERHSDSQVSKLSTTYFRGLNYLLNEQPDKAIELFLHIAELDKDTFETQVALGHQVQHLFAGLFLAHEGGVFGDDLGHFGLDRGEILDRQAVLQVEIVVEPFGRVRTDVEQGIRPQAAHRGRHHVRRAVAHRL